MVNPISIMTIPKFKKFHGRDRQSKLTKTFSQIPDFIWNSIVEIVKINWKLIEIFEIFVDVYHDHLIIKMVLYYGHSQNGHFDDNHLENLIVQWWCYVKWRQEALIALVKQKSCFKLIESYRHSSRIFYASRCRRMNLSWGLWTS
jgi:hypothetical protein